MSEQNYNTAVLLLSWLKFRGCLDYGLCYELCKLRKNGDIGSVEIDNFCKMIDKDLVHTHYKLYKDGSGLLFKPGLYEPRVKYLEEKISDY